jgi:hypothetical protein
VELQLNQILHILDSFATRPKSIGKTEKEQTLLSSRAWPSTAAAAKVLKTFGVLTP